MRRDVDGLAQAAWVASPYSCGTAPDSLIVLGHRSSSRACQVMVWKEGSPTIGSVWGSNEAIGQARLPTSVEEAATRWPCWCVV